MRLAVALYCLICLLLGQTAGAFAQDLTVIADPACFKYEGSDDVTCVEIIYSLVRNQFQFQPDTVGYYAVAEMSAKIVTATGEVVDSSAWPARFRVSSLAEAYAPNYLTNDLLVAELKPGDYTLYIAAKDAISGRSGQTTIDLVVPSLPSGRLVVSEIQFLYGLLPPDGGIFDRAGRKIIPNTRRIFSHDDTLAFFYAELYGLKPENKNYSICLTMLDAGGGLYKEIVGEPVAITATRAPIFNGFNLSAIKPGAYTLVLTVYSGSETASTQKTFEVVGGRYEQVAPNQADLAAFPEATEIKTEADAKKFKDEIAYICTREELKQYESLPLSAKSAFARAFWQRRDPNPSTPVNEFAVEHYRRLKYANEAFSTFRSPNAEPNGWKTDMGRVYIIYGPPSDEENHPSSLGELPWKRWNYDHIQGGIYFIFIDETGYGDYRLVHSTAKGEPQYPNWEARLRPSSTIR